MAIKTLTIRELHEHTGKLVRAAEKVAFVLTDRGRQVAILKPLSPADLPSRPFTRGRRARPRVGVDSTTYISQDRGGR